MQNTIAKSIEEDKIQLNGINFEQLFKKYEEIGFIYPAKKALLAPHFKLIKDNWEKLLNNKKDVLWVLSKTKATKKHFASVSVLKQNNYGMLAQHLVSSGNPFLSLEVMMAAQHRAQYHFGESEVRSSQNWFRPNNRYAYRIFASMYEKLGPENASLLPFHYLHLGLDKINETQRDNFIIEEVQGIDPEFITFVKQQYGNVFVQAEELDQEDIQLSALNNIYSESSLKRSRKVFKIKDCQTQQVIASIVANRAPLGLNFSFLENRSYYILDKELDQKKRALVLKTMNAAIKPYYQDLAFEAIPIVTDALTAQELQVQKAKLFREYIQSIWLREGFTLWYEHINSFLRRIARN